jgi:hypothetical protein
MRGVGPVEPENWFTVREAHRGGPGGFDGQRVRLPDPGAAADGGDCGKAETGEERAQYHAMANPAKGEKLGERGLQNNWLSA